MDSYRHDGLTFDVSDAAPGNAVPREADPGHSHLGSAEAVVLLHGFPQDRHCWQAVARQLNEAGLRTLAPDQRGYSPGACPPAVSDYAMEHLVGDVVALLDAAHVQRAHLVGHDWGGGVAWALAATHPERVASLTVLSTPHPAAMGAAMLHGQVLRSWYMGAFQVPRLPERLLARQLPRALRGAGLPPAEVRRYADRFAEPERLRGPINWYRAMVRGGARLGLGVVTVPTTYVWGEQDPYLGRAAALKTSEFVGADYRFVPVRAGHWLPEIEPRLVVDEVLARVRGASGGPAAAEPPAAEPAAAEPVGTPSGNLSVLERLGAAEFVALTTFRRSGEPVTTPMWVARDGDELVFTTPTDSGKIKRLRRDPRVRVQVCSRLGKIQPGALAADGQATLAAGAAEVARGSAVLRRKYGWQYAVMLRAERLFKREQLDRTILRVRLG